MRKIIRFLAGAAGCAALVFGIVKLTDYIRENNQSISLKETLIEDAVVLKNPASQISDADSVSERETESEAEQLSCETAPIEVDFDVLMEKNGDIIGWLYCEDTPINFPVVQSSNNSYYLRRMVDGTWNSSGSLFADYRNSRDFSDKKTIIYGHNMKNNEMFGTLPNYEEQSYFDGHSVMWLLTPDADYKIELIAGYVTSTDSDVYSFDRTDEEVFAIIGQSVEKSSFKTDAAINQEDRFIVLSTCSYEYDNARYVLIGRLMPL